MPSSDVAAQKPARGQAELHWPQSSGHLGTRPNAVQHFRCGYTWTDSARCACTIDGLLITHEDADEPYDMGEHGRLLVGVSRLVQSPPGMWMGFALHFAQGSVGIADLGDELVVAPWPADDWARWNVSIE